MAIHDPELELSGNITTPVQVSATTLLRTLLTAMRGAILPRLGIAAAMAELQQALATDCLLFNSPALATKDSILHQSDLLPDGLKACLRGKPFIPRQSVIRFSAETHHAILLCESMRSLPPLGLICWKSSPWSAEETDLLKTVLSIIATILEHDALQHRILEDTHYDLASNLLNWDGLKDNLDRRVPRLDRECLPATLMVVHVPGLTDITQDHGFEAGEEALAQCIDLLRQAVRPTDAMARLSSNTFALWMDGGDRFAMAERAERMTAHGVPLLIDPPTHLQMLIGLVSREPNDSQSTPESLLEQATQALHDALDEQKKWRFSYEAP